MDFLQTNRHLWNTWTEVHLKSAFYDLEGFKAGKSSLNSIELEQLGDIRGKKLLHLQCHFGQDTLSLARLGAEVTGIDLSDQAVEAARALAAELKLPARFVEGNVLEADQLLTGEQFDVIFTSYGAIGWLPELRTWGKVIRNLLRPGGEFHLVEFHPVVYLFDEPFTKIIYPYFNRGPIIEEVNNSYADREAKVSARAYSWPHSLSDIFTALLEQGLRIESFREFDTSPYDCFQNTVPVEGGFQIRGMEGYMPLAYALKALG